MAVRPLRTAETIFVSDTPADSNTPVNAVASAGIVFDKILMAANDTVYEVTIDADGALAVAEVSN